MHMHTYFDLLYHYYMTCVSRITYHHFYLLSVISHQSVDQPISDNASGQLLSMPHMFLPFAMRT